MDSPPALAEQSSRVDGILTPRAFTVKTHRFTAKGGGIGLGGLADRRIADGDGGERKRRARVQFVKSLVPYKKQLHSTIHHHTFPFPFPFSSLALARRTRSKCNKRNIAFTSVYSDRGAVVPALSASLSAPVFNRFTARPSASTSASSSSASTVAIGVDTAARRVDARLFVAMRRNRMNRMNE